MKRLTNPCGIIGLCLFILMIAMASILYSACEGDDDDDDSGEDDTGDDDDTSDLIWQDPPSGDLMCWDKAKLYCQNLDFDDQDDWRLPTISEVRSLIRGCDATETGGSCGVTDDCTEKDCSNDQCEGCEPLQGPGSGGFYWPDGMTGEIEWYWSSSSVADSDYSEAWLIDFSGAAIDWSGIHTESKATVRCVRP